MRVLTVFFHTPSTDVPVTITKPLNGETIKESQSVTFTCKVSAPDAAVTWLCDGKPIIVGDNCEISVNGTLHKLTLKNCQLSDEAEYTIKTANDESKASLTVKGKNH